MEKLNGKKADLNKKRMSGVRKFMRKLKNVLRENMETSIFSTSCMD
jgi:hypothetical protein